MFHDEVGILWWLMCDFEELLALCHHVCIMTHCFREANKSAVCLARVGITSGINRVFESLDQLLLEVRSEVTLEWVGTLLLGLNSACQNGAIALCTPPFMYEQ